ncbi:glycosyltransferase family 2 protein [Nesterenkonia natronophila]|uniref:glycosyltransferase family 2 protein n=1 Tax=Nesterenkonia natronophila TaxID=2174932 RepID=UPI0013149D9F|nr:glycosyltransferase [Nesterenkonia natronophila]
MRNEPVAACAPTAENTWVLVCTYRRNDLLAQLLLSLRSVRMPPDATIAQPQLIVVDNAPEPTAQHLVGCHYPGAVYVHEPRPGIATARNASLDALPLDAAAVIFVDDDEQVTPNWFTHLLSAALESSADAVGGPVLPVFDHGEPEWVRTYGYVRRTDFPSGPHQRRLATNNTLVLADWFHPARHGGRGYRFDETFNFIGGSDSELFERMMRAGAHYWWCAEAVVTEHVPADRATQHWLRRRALRGGQVRAAKRQLRSADSRPAAAAFAVAAEGLARASYGAVRRFGRRFRGHSVTYTDDYYLCEGLGMLQAVIGRGGAEYARKN